MAADGMFIRSLILPNLGAGSGVFIWGFRACASGHSDCRILEDGFRSVFGLDSGRVLGHILGLSRLIGYVGGRKVRLGVPGSVQVTPDEMSLLSAIRAGQHNDVRRAENHLKWILAGKPKEGLVGLVQDIAVGFLSAGLIVENGAKIPRGMTPEKSRRFFAIQGGRA